MAEANAAKKEEEAKGAEEEKAASGGKKPIMLILLMGINTLVMLGVGAGLYMFSSQVKEATQSQTTVNESDLITPPSKEAKIVAIEPFYVNLSGSEGYKLLKVTMSMEVENSEVQAEVSQRQAQIRDIVLVLLSSKSYGEISGDNAKKKLKEEIMDTVNSFLTKGRVQKILFTEFIFN